MIKFIKRYNQYYYIKNKIYRKFIMVNIENIVGRFSKKRTRSIDIKYKNKNKNKRQVVE
jgi:hypothetical protein